MHCILTVILRLKQVFGLIVWNKINPIKSWTAPTFTFVLRAACKLHEKCGLLEPTTLRFIVIYSQQLQLALHGFAGPRKQSKVIWFDSQLTLPLYEPRGIHQTCSPSGDVRTLSGHHAPGRGVLAVRCFVCKNSVELCVCVILLRRTCWLFTGLTWEDATLGQMIWPTPPWSGYFLLPC